MNPLYLTPTLWELADRGSEALEVVRFLQVFIRTSYKTKVENYKDTQINTDAVLSVCICVHLWFVLSSKTRKFGENVGNDE
jgi:hypothetical protein